MNGSNTIGELITTLRSKNRMSQKDLADFLYVNQGTVSRWERGIRFPDTELIEKMAALFGVDASVLIQAPLSHTEIPEILVVDDEPILLGDVAETVSEAIPESTVRPFRWASDALAYAEGHRIDIAFLDIELVGGNGLDLAKGLLRINPQCNIIFLTSHPEYTKEALDMFCSGYIIKPLTPSKIKEQIEHLRFGISGINI